MTLNQVIAIAANQIYDLNDEISLFSQKYSNLMCEYVDAYTYNVYLSYHTYLPIYFNLISHVYSILGLTYV